MQETIDGTREDKSALRIEIHKYLNILMHQKIDRIVDRAAIIKENISPYSYKKTFKNIKTFYLDLLKAGNHDSIRIIFGAFE